MKNRPQGLFFIRPTIQLFPLAAIEGEKRLLVFILYVYFKINFT